MTLLDLIRREAAVERRSTFAAAALCGAANAFILALIQLIVQKPDRASERWFALFALGILLYAFGARRTYRWTTRVVETALHHVKIRIVEKIERAGLEELERIGTAEIYDRLTENVSVISGSARMIALVMQCACSVTFGTLLLAWLSPPAFVLLAALQTGGLMMYFSKKREIDAYLREVAQARLTFFEMLMDLLRGFKEIKFSLRREREIRKDLTQASASLRAAMLKADNLFDDSWILLNCNLFALLVVLVFALPIYQSLEASTMKQLVAGVLFVWGSLLGALFGFPAYLRSNMALEQIQALEEKLDATAREKAPAVGAEDPWKGQFTALCANNIEYKYRNEGQHSGGRFHVGPLSLTVTRGEVVFIVGGNGSGKSTLLKVLTGLYRPTDGDLRVDDIVVHPGNVQAYREMISAIYSDFHLFNKLYGLLGVEGASVHRLLGQMQLDGETSFADRRFTKRALSTGQRKRLAMIVALLEDRPICIFDEWAADQDPEFRRYFYEELLPELRRRGKTVIAVSHDDRYFHCADRVVTMEYGKIRSVRAS